MEADLGEKVMLRTAWLSQDLIGWIPLLHKLAEACKRRLHLQLSSFNPAVCGQQSSHQKIGAPSTAFRPGPLRSEFTPYARISRVPAYIRDPTFIRVPKVPHLKSGIPESPSNHRPQSCPLNQHPPFIRIPEFILLTS